jgi:hypothetical protein
MSRFECFSTTPFAAAPTSSAPWPGSSTTIFGRAEGLFGVSRMTKAAVGAGPNDVSPPSIWDKAGR